MQTYAYIICHLSMNNVTLKDTPAKGSNMRQSPSLPKLSPETICHCPTLRVKVCHCNYKQKKHV